MLINNDALKLLIQEIGKDLNVEAAKARVVERLNLSPRFKLQLDLDYAFYDENDGAFVDLHIPEEINKTKFLIGEIVIAEITAFDNGCFEVSVPGAPVKPHIVEGNAYTTFADAASAVKYLVPAECQDFIKEYKS